MSAVSVLSGGSRVSLFLASSGGHWHSLAPGCLVPVSASVVTLPSLLFVSVSNLLLTPFYEDTCNCI